MRIFHGRRRALADRRFRWLLLAIASAGVIPDFVWNAVLVPLLTPDARYGDFQVYQQAAARIAAGSNPYVDFLSGSNVNDTYIYPPFFAWLLQPLAHASGDARALFIIACNLLFLAVTILAICRGLGVSDRQITLGVGLAMLGFFPVIDNFYWGQVMLGLLALGSLWFWAWADGGRWWGSAALGVAIAVKLVQAPLLAIFFFERRMRLLAGCLATSGALLLLGSQWLPLYTLKVFPGIDGGTGWMGNYTPTGAFIRLVNPESYTSHDWISSPLPRAFTLVFATAALLASRWLATQAVLGRQRRIAEAALCAATLPLIAPSAWSNHLALELLPLTVAAVLAVASRHWLALTAAVLAWMLMGPANAWFWTQASSGALSGSILVRPLAEMPTLGVGLCWLSAAAVTWRLRSARSGAPPQETIAHPLELSSRLAGTG